MGQTDEARLEHKSRSKARAGGKAASPWTRKTNREECDITAVDPAVMGAAVIAVAAAGAALMVSTTRDGGAVSLTLFDNDEKERTYAHSADEINDLLLGLIEQYGR